MRVKDELQQMETSLLTVLQDVKGRVNTLTGKFQSLNRSSSTHDDKLRDEERNVQAQLAQVHHDIGILLTPAGRSNRVQQDGNDRRISSTPKVSEVADQHIPEQRAAKESRNCVSRSMDDCKFEKRNAECSQLFHLRSLRSVHQALTQLLPIVSQVNDRFKKANEQNHARLPDRLDALSHF